jgi:hypothetical protein
MKLFTFACSHKKCLISLLAIYNYNNLHNFIAHAKTSNQQANSQVLVKAQQHSPVQEERAMKDFYSFKSMLLYKFVRRELKVQELFTPQILFEVRFFTVFFPFPVLFFSQFVCFYFLKLSKKVVFYPAKKNFFVFSNYFNANGFFC